MQSDDLSADARSGSGSALLPLIEDIFELSHMAAWEWSFATGAMTWSTDPEVLFGFPRGSLGPPLRMATAIHREDLASFQEAVAAALSSGRFECEYRAVRPNGRIVWIAERGRVVGGPGAASEGMVGISRDISRERQADVEGEHLRRSERQARDEAERQSRIRDEFLATLSHELRTPMNAILGWLSMLNNGRVCDMKQALSVIERNARAQAHLIEDLLLMNTLAMGTARLQVAVVDVALAVEAAVESLRPAAEAKSVTVDVAIEPALPLITADANRIQQVLWNLVHNGIKFTPAGGRVDVRAVRDREGVRLIVRDDGQGIAPDFLPHVFDRFRQADASTTRTALGLGLGLSIARHLVELHGGSIEAISDGVGRGAAFVVRLPNGARGDHVPTVHTQLAALDRAVTGRA